MKSNLLLWIFFLFIQVFSVYGQNRDSLISYLKSSKPGIFHSATILKDSTPIDSFSIISNSLQVFDKNEKVFTDFQLQRNQLIFNRKSDTTSLPMKARYLRLPFDFYKSRSNKKRIDISPQIRTSEDYVIGTGFTYNPFEEKASQFADFKGLDYMGSFSRGLSLGNKQDLILNSGFNLQLGGKLGDVEITAAISDNNIPVQPSGNTQQLSDFDRIFILFKLGKSSLQAGDFDLKKSDGGYFLQYFRRLQGAQAQTTFKTKDWIHSTEASFSFSKGSFARNVFNGIEGNQGPYRLKGANGETFIIIIAGTERVYMDDILLQRGAEFDYVIDYNSGELTFTNRRLITKDKRIQVEFNYTDLSYLRTIYTLNHKLEYKGFRFLIQWYSEQDAKDQPVFGNLSDEVKDLLSKAGDNSDQIYVSGVRSYNANSNENLSLLTYRMKDSIVQGVLYDSIYFYSNIIDSMTLSVKFSPLAQGGDYIKVNDATNGTVFAWVAPDSATGRSRGTHGPVEKMISPKMKQMLNSSIEWDLKKGGIWKADFALSHKDLNTFSEIGNDDNLGFASRIGYQNQIIFQKKNLQKDSSARDSLPQKLQIQMHYEFLQNRFELIEPFRNREFNRDWSVVDTVKRNEHLFYARALFDAIQWGKIGYEFSGYLRQNFYQGFRHALQYKLQHKSLAADFQIHLTESKSDLFSTYFLRPKGELTYTFQKLSNFKMGIFYEMDQNRVKDFSVDTLMANSIYFQQVKAFAELPINENTFIKASYQRRYDYQATKTDFSILTIGDDVNVSSEWKWGRFSQLQLNFNYRNLWVNDQLSSTFTPKSTYLGRFEYQLNIKKGFIKTTTIYELGSGQQQKIAYNYVQVDKGNGTHIWIDRNEDGIQQQNEFELSVFQDQANFIRVTVLTNEFVQTNNVSLNQNIDIEPAVLFRNMKKDSSSLRWLGRFSARSIIKLERKSIAGSNTSPFNPFYFENGDSNMVAMNSSIRNFIFFNRTSSRFKIELQQADIRSRTLLNIGFEQKRRTEYQTILSGKLYKNLRYQLMGLFAQIENGSELFRDRNFNIDLYETESTLTYLYESLWRISCKYKFKFQENQIEGLEKSTAHELQAEGKFASAKKGISVKASFSWVLLDFKGNFNTPVQFAMTQALLNGNNFLWTFQFEKNLSKNIQLSLSYEGRKTGEAEVVHVGRAQIRAIF